MGATTTTAPAPATMAEVRRWWSRRWITRRRTSTQNATRAAAATALLFVVIVVIVTMMTMMMMHYVNDDCGEKEDDKIILSLLKRTTLGFNNDARHRHRHNHHVPPTHTSVVNKELGTSSNDIPLRVQSKPGFPSFHDYSMILTKDTTTTTNSSTAATSTTPIIDVSYDGRSLLLNKTRRILLLGGSIHPGWRIPQDQYEIALDNAVRHGLNLITLLIFWNSHQPYYSDSSSWNWNFPTPSIHNSDEDWNLASAIHSAANRGLFVHLRFGPYICGEYTNGGIPQWLGIQYPNMTMRSSDSTWFKVMGDFLNVTTTYIRQNQLWSYQGGNVILAQVENEYNGNDQDYVEWMGNITQELEPNVIWTMDNGQSATNTLLTSNCIDEDCITYLQHHGRNGRIQIDQPAMLTELEGGFQTWGEPSHPQPYNYIWGRTAKDLARYTMKWFARGGTHVNHYMWFGGYHRGNSVGANVANMYAGDVFLCSSGEYHQPKFGHFQDLHHLLADIADILLYSPTALYNAQSVEHWNTTSNTWQTGEDQRLFVYPPPEPRTSSEEEGDDRVVVFLENDSDVDVLVRIPSWKMMEKKKRNLNSNDDDDMVHVQLLPKSVKLLVDGVEKFDSAYIRPEYMQYERKAIVEPVKLVSWSTWPEYVGASANDPQTIRDDHPVEQSVLNFVQGRAADSDYAWYETKFNITSASQPGGALYVDTQRAAALVAYIDGRFVDTVYDNRTRPDAGVTFTMNINFDLSSGQHTLAILSESLGYPNGATGSGKAKKKGVTGNVVLVMNHGSHGNSTQNLVDGREWLSFPGLHGDGNQHELLKPTRQKFANEVGIILRETHHQSSSPPTWSCAVFPTPNYDTRKQQALFIELTRGRGHLWLNGNDLGRFWNITRGTTTDYTQKYYFLPGDFLYQDGRLNEILLFNSLGGNLDPTDRYNDPPKLVLSWIEPSNTSRLLDEVDYPSACLY